MKTPTWEHRQRLLEGLLVASCGSTSPSKSFRQPYCKSRAVGGAATISAHTESAPKAAAGLAQSGATFRSTGASTVGSKRTRTPSRLTSGPAADGQAQQWLVRLRSYARRQRGPAWPLPRLILGTHKNRQSTSGWWYSYPSENISQLGWWFFPILMEK